MRKAILIAVCIMFALPAFCLAGGDMQWNWNRDGHTTDGSMTFKDEAGNPFEANLNPTGDNVKVNESTAREAPVVYVQSGASSGNRECIPWDTSSCPSGYTSVWSKSGHGCPHYSIYNVAGTNYNVKAKKYWTNDGLSYDEVGWVYFTYSPYNGETCGSTSYPHEWDNVHSYGLNGHGAAQCLTESSGDVNWTLNLCCKP